MMYGLRRSIVRLVTVGAAVSALAPAARAQDVLTVVGAGGQSKQYSVRQLQAFGRDTIRIAAHHDQSATYTVVPLRRLLSDVGLEIDSLRGRQLSLVVVAEARDAYRVALSLGELAPGLGERDVLVAYLRDGAPLAATEAPFRLIVQGDERGARSIRQLVTLRVVDAAVVTAPQPSQRSRPSSTNSSSRSSG